ncbi:MAG: LPS export ABC transporter permease LptG [Coxiellaceae bacterium]|nr:MAG: LPS export ABC transporter permease LptG [Coxiellaceae bacterium]
MGILDRYIARAVIESALLVLLVLLGIESFITFVSELRDIGTRDYGISQVLWYVPQLLPSNIYQFFPMAGLIGSLLALGRLASRSELIVMRAAGLSISQITWAVLKAAVLLLIIAMALGEWIGPHAQQHAEMQKAVAMSGGQAINTQQGLWVREGNNFIHINQVIKRGQLQGITRYEFDRQHHLAKASFAESGVYQDGRWTFYNVKQSTLGKERVVSRPLAQEIWNIHLDPRLLGISETDPNQQSLPKLYHSIQYLNQSGQDSNQYQFVFWQRIFQPLATLIMVCLGIPFIFGPLRSTTMGLRMVAGIITGFTFYTLNEFFGPFSMVYQFPPLLAAALPTILFAMVGVILLWSMR